MLSLSIQQTIIETNYHKRLRCDPKYELRNGYVMEWYPREDDKGWTEIVCVGKILYIPHTWRSF